LPSPSSISLAGQLDCRESCLCGYSSLRSFFFRSPSLSPHSPSSIYTLNWRDYEKKWSLKLNRHSNIAPKRQAFKTSNYSPKRRGAWAPAYLRVYTEQHLYGDNYNRGSASGRGPTGGDKRHWRLKKKRQRQKHAHYWQQFTRAQFPGGRFPAKFGCRPIKLEIYLLAHTHPANYVRVHFRHLGVYKESREAYRAIRVRVS